MTVGGREAMAVDIVIADAPKNFWPACGSPCVVTMPFDVDHEDGPIKADGDTVFGGSLGEYDRLVVVEVGGQQLLIDIGGPDAKSFKAFLPLAEEVVGSIAFG